MDRLNLTQNRRGNVRRALAALLVLFFLIITGAGRFPSYAATALSTPVLSVEGKYTASWKKVDHAGSYEVKVTMKSLEEEKTVTRTVVVSATKLDLTLFAAGNEVTFSVRALPKDNKYGKSSFADYGKVIEPDEENETYGFAGVEKNKYYLADTENKKITGWQKVNGTWYYFDPANSGLTATGRADIDGKSYCFDTNGKMQTGWVAFEGYWYFYSSSGAMVTGWHESFPNTYYFFTESASAAQPKGSLDMTTTKATYPDAKAPKELSSGGSVSAPGASTDGTVPTSYWRQNPGGSWSYYQDGKLVKGKWLAVDGFWYCFDSNGLMLTGWQFLNSRWYYLEPNKNGSNGYKCGAMWVNATTPDGFTVNESGQWVVDGIPVTTKTMAGSAASASKNTSGTTPASSQAKAEKRKIATCNLTLAVTDGAPGKCRQATVTGATNSKVLSQTYSKPYEQWNVGSTVSITVELQANDGYYYYDSTKFSCTNAKIVSKSGGETTKTIVLNYTPVQKLSPVTTAYVTDEDELRWIPVANAKRYKVILTGGELTSAKTLYVTDAKLDLTDYGDINDGGMSAVITAMGAEGNKNVIESDKFSTGDLEPFRNTYFCNGTFTRKENRLLYVDEEGEKLKGWQQILGNWYHFKKNGLTEAPGWYQDETGYWYYFDIDCRMVTGSVTENGKTYRLNDGSRTDLPYGSWIQ